MSGLDFATTVESHLPKQTDPAADQTLKVIAWNIERGYHLKQQAALLKEHQPDIVFVSESDIGMARTNQAHTSRFLAESLGDYNYIYGVEFLELDLGDVFDRKRFTGAHNDIGYHGNSILAKFRLQRPALVRLEDSGLFFREDPVKVSTDKRIGGRCAVLAEINLGPKKIVLASVHLENNANSWQRAQQMDVLLKAIDTYSPDSSAIIGGDLNTLTDAYIAYSKPERAALARFWPQYFLDPTRSEPLFEKARTHGYEWQQSNYLGVSSQRLRPTPQTGHQDPPSRGYVRHDWFLTKHLKSTNPKTLEAVEAGQPTFALSDHEPIMVQITHNQ